MVGEGGKKGPSAKYSKLKREDYGTNGMNYGKQLKRRLIAC